ncbi:Lysophospholipase L1 [Flagellimonas taeanensis]|jgi:lysophospholipase L1-like esterase|uniref:Lysophospholipase L1 n=1 Tax=Flagellimonas taeanensis TaxID=1005926 RepID=A0A1M6S0I0_9FLAO|nr:GDSL-type esterase/lipase family protein [Allomuricauda taeanensis]MEE1962892.1 GDSL-type esterase/lipase family protein [Allomuricauda taeanensis]SFB77277.1 Lysophospholipase L1 [Allomuricauda taeanensis]SHK38087.1 Lysophospholipase L1 [Allomuricauda taeanensis]
MKKILILLLFLPVLGWAQAPNRFDEEVNEIKKKNDTLWDVSRPAIVFTGSSSVRLWEDLQDRFPDQQVLNTGFGGSQFSDLELYLDELILSYDPVKVFIYEGDNDVNAKVKLRTIVDTSERILDVLQQKKQGMEIVLISPKPSISRWKLRGKYKRLNRKLARLASKTEGVEFVDVWYPMLEKRKLKQDIFIEDGLHMNSKGYDIWYDVIKNYVE